MVLYQLFIYVAACISLLTPSKAEATAAALKDRNLQQNDDVYSAYPKLEICDDLIIQVSSIQTVCDSPQTFYYGSGVNRNSKTCNFGDKATTTVYFDVTEDLGDINIYVVMSVYAGYGNEVLTSTSPKNLKKYVGYSCSSAGSYSYSYTTTLGSASSSYGSFIPYIQIAFSSETNGDYNLGAANIPCQWEEFGAWTEVAAKTSQFTARDFFVEYGILFGTVAVCFIFVGLFWARAVSQSKFMKAKHNDMPTSDTVYETDDDRSNALMMPPEVTSA